MKKNIPGSMNIYYTYHLIDPETNKIFYVGKGKGQRAYIHLTRALHWRETGISVPGANFHLYNKLLKIYSKGLNPIYAFVLTDVIEKEALAREIEDISKIGLSNLCNLTFGGEGETRSPESLEKLSQSLQKLYASERGDEVRAKIAKSKMGEKNPMWGKKYDEETIKKKVDAMLSVPRWNKGLKGDPRSKGPPKGNVPHNVIQCRLVNEDGRVFEANSIVELSRVSGVPLISIQRLHLGIYKKNKKGWKFELAKHGHQSI
jgi:NUMOD3 motif